MNLSELRKAVRDAESALRQVLPPMYVANGLTATHSTSGTNVFMGDCKTTLNENQSASLRDWLIAAYPLDTAPDAGWVSVEEGLPPIGEKVLVDLDGYPTVAERNHNGNGWMISINSETPTNPVLQWKRIGLPPVAKGGRGE